MPDGDRGDYFSFRLEPELQNTAEIFRSAINDLKNQLTLLMTDLSSTIRQSSMINMQTKMVMSYTQPFPPVSTQLPITQLLQRLEESRMMEIQAVPAQTLPGRAWQFLRAMTPVQPVVPPLIPTMGITPPPVDQLSYSVARNVAQQSLYWQVYGAPWTARVATRALQFGAQFAEFAGLFPLISTIAGPFTIPLMIGSAFIPGLNQYMFPLSSAISEMVETRNFIANLGMRVPRLGVAGGVGFTPEEITQIRRGLTEVQQRFRDIPGAGRYGLESIARTSFEALVMAGQISPVASVADILRSINQLTNVLYDLARRYDTTVEKISQALIEIRGQVPTAKLEDIGAALRAAQPLSMLPGVTMSDVIQNIIRGGQLAPTLRIPVSTAMMLGQQLATIRYGLPFFRGIQYSPEFEQLLLSTFVDPRMRFALLGQMRGARGDIMNMMTAGAAPMVTSPDAFFKFMATSDLQLKNVTTNDLIDVQMNFYTQMLKNLGGSISRDTLAGILRTFNPNVSEEEARRLADNFLYAREIAPMAQVWAREQQKLREAARQYRMARILSGGSIDIAALFLSPERAAEWAQDVASGATQFSDWIRAGESAVKRFFRETIAEPYKELVAVEIEPRLEQISSIKTKTIQRIAGPLPFEYMSNIPREHIALVQQYGAPTLAQIFAGREDKLRMLLEQAKKLGIQADASTVARNFYVELLQKERPIEVGREEKEKIAYAIERLRQAGKLTRENLINMLRTFQIFKNMDEATLIGKISGYITVSGEKLPFHLSPIDIIEQELVNKKEKAAELLGSFGEKLSAALLGMEEKPYIKSFARAIEKLDKTDQYALLLALEYHEQNDKKKQEFIKSTANAWRVSEEEVKKLIELGQKTLSETFGQNWQFAVAAYTQLRPEIGPLLLRRGTYLAYTSYLAPGAVLTGTTAPEKKEEEEKASKMVAWQDVRDAANKVIESLQTFSKSLEQKFSRTSGSHEEKSSAKR